MRHAAIALAVLLTACNGAPTKRTELSASVWTCTTAVETGTKLGGCAIGDVDPRYPGSEIVAVASDGAVHVVHRDGDRWVGEVVFRAGGEMIQCAVGNVDRSTDAAEIAVCGMLEGGEDDGGAGAVHVLSYREDRRAASFPWFADRVLLDKALVHGVCVHDGSVLATGFSRLLYRIGRSDVALWETEGVLVGKTPGNGKQIVSTDNGAVIACDDGWVGRVVVTADGGTVTTVDVRDVGRARLGAAGDWIAVADDDGTLSLIRDGKREAVYRSPEKSKLRGAVVADLDPTVDGYELACAGYDGQIVVLTRSENGWSPEVVGTDTKKFHHLTAGDVDGDGAPELVAVGYSGRILVIDRR